VFHFNDLNWEGQPKGIRRPSTPSQSFAVLVITVQMQFEWWDNVAGCRCRHFPAPSSLAVSIAMIQPGAFERSEHITIPGLCWFAPTEGTGTVVAILPFVHQWTGSEVKPSPSWWINQSDDNQSPEDGSGANSRNVMHIKWPYLRHWALFNLREI
jgi:hypothetical protein